MIIILFALLHQQAQRSGAQVEVKPLFTVDVHHKVCLPFQNDHTAFSCQSQWYAQ